MAQAGPGAVATRITRDKDFAAQLVEVISELDLTEDEARSYFKTLDPAVIESEKNRLMLLKEVMQYEGFNPRQMIAQLIK